MKKGSAVLLGLTLAASLAMQVHAQSSAPAARVDGLFEKWDFTGSDGSGLAWRGTLTIGALDPGRFDPNPVKYNHMCQLELRSASSGRGKEMPCLYDQRTRTLSFSGGGFSNKYSYSAVLSAD